jgi:hypothetical protein
MARYIFSDSYAATVLPIIREIHREILAQKPPGDAISNRAIDRAIARALAARGVVPSYCPHLNPIERLWPIPVSRGKGEPALSGTLNAGETFEVRAVATAGASTYAGIVRMVTAAQTAKAPFIRLADRYALLLLPVTLAVAGVAWLLSGDSIRGLAVLVAATPCPLILAAPVAFIAGVSQAARNGILIKGGGALEALARTHTVMFDKTGTLTVGGARLIAVETAPGESADEVLRLAGSLEQASHHIIAAAIVEAALARGLAIEVPRDARETMGSGLEGRVGDRKVCVGSHELVHGARKPEQWAVHVLRRASWRSALSVFVSVDGCTVGRCCSAMNCGGKRRVPCRPFATPACRGSSWSPGIAPTPPKPSAPPSTSTPSSPTACPPTRSMRSRPSSA